jgi:hypothetical protein
MLVPLAEVALFSNSDAKNSVEAAPEKAKALARDLEQIGEVVSASSRDAGLVALLTNQELLHRLRSEPAWQLDRANNPLLERVREVVPPLKTNENWLLLGTGGEVLANLTRNPGAKVLRPRIDREYFKSVLRHREAYFVSQPYKSESEGLIKVAVIAPILDRSSQFLGALAKMVSFKELLSTTDRTITAVIGPTSAGSGLPTNAFAVVWHPRLDKTEAKPILDRGLESTFEQLLSPSGAAAGVRKDDYHDPVDSPGPNSKWIASFVRVPGTSLILVYQVRDRVEQALLTAGILFLPCAVVLILSLVKKWRANRGEPAQRVRGPGSAGCI